MFGEYDPLIAPTHVAVFAEMLGYTNEIDYLWAFGDPKTRADLADRFVKLANKEGIGAEVGQVIYE